ncbi:MAG: DUF4915 domain-containing protein [Gemmataceae bacterium]
MLSLHLPESGQSCCPQPEYHAFSLGGPLRYLISLCNKPSGSAERAGHLLECDTDHHRIRSIPLLHPALPTTFFGLTGLCRWRDGFVVVTQSVPSALAFLSLRYEVVEVWPLQLVRDGHSIIARDDKLYIASTGNNSIVEFDPKSGERIWWQDSESQGDVLHVNALCWAQQDLLITAFGRKKGELWATAHEGYVANLNTNTRLMSSLHQPHSLLAAADGIYVCESSRLAVRRDDGQTLLLGLGYLRGLLVTEKHLCVGISQGRQRSRSTGQRVENPGEPGLRAGKCGVAVYRRTGRNLADLQPIGILPLGPFGREVYDLLLVEE